MFQKVQIASIPVFLKVWESDLLTINFHPRQRVACAHHTFQQMFFAIGCVHFDSKLSAANERAPTRVKFEKHRDHEGGFDGSTASLPQLCGLRP